MANARDIKTMINFIKKSEDAMVRGYTIAMIESAELAESFALAAIQRNFNNTKDRVRTGGLAKGLYHKFTKPSASEKFPKAAIGVRGVPYAATMEFGDDNRIPKNRNHLWVKTEYKGKFKRLTPTEFMNLRAKNKGVKKTGGKLTYEIFTSKKGNLVAAAVANFKTKPNEVRTLFALKKQVKIKPRPYLRPAVNKALLKMPSLIRKRIAEQKV